MDSVRSDIEPQRRQSLVRVAASITVLNLTISAMAVICGPLQARALGPGGAC